jgi:hypothetical protein
VWSVAEGSDVHAATSFRGKMSSAFTHHQQHCPNSVNTQELDQHQQLTTTKPEINKWAVFLLTKH